MTAPHARRYSSDRHPGRADAQGQAAGQRVLDATGNLEAVQKLLGHASIQTTGDVYTDWDIDQLAVALLEVIEDEARESFPA